MRSPKDGTIVAWVGTWSEGDMDSAIGAAYAARGSLAGLTNAERRRWESMR